MVVLYRHVEMATPINPTTRPTFFSRVSILSSSGWWCTQIGTLRNALDIADRIILIPAREAARRCSLIPHTSHHLRKILVSDDILELMAGKELVFHP
jgi:hypothetical protein